MRYLQLGSILHLIVLLGCSSRSEHLVHDFVARNADGTVNVVVEIPAGTTAKFEVDKTTGRLEWEIGADGEERIIDFLPYPANYGLVPATLLSTADGGDGDPLDVVVLGGALDRGSIVRVRIIAALRLLDRGEVDDKLIAVSADEGSGNPLAILKDLGGLRANYPNIVEILELWFAGYKGPGVIELGEWLSASDANALLLRAEKAYDDSAQRGL